MPSDPYNLARFLKAQENVFTYALGELQGGQKRSHWMWFKLCASSGARRWSGIWLILMRCR